MTWKQLAEAVAFRPVVLDGGLAAVLERCAMVVANDSGPLHLARARRYRHWRTCCPATRSGRHATAEWTIRR